MKKVIPVFLFCIVFSLGVFSQNTYLIPISDRYYAKVRIDDMNDESYPGSISIYQSNAKISYNGGSTDDVSLNQIRVSESEPDKELLQVKSEDLNLGEEFGIESVSVPYDIQNVVIYEDFNFDGIKDLAIRDGYKSDNSDDATYQIYLADKEGGFRLSKELSDLTYGCCGLFEIDPDKKELFLWSKQECLEEDDCSYLSYTFDVVDDKPRLKQQVEEMSVENTPFSERVVLERNGEEMVVTEGVYRFNNYDSSDLIFAFDIPADNTKIVLYRYQDILYYMLLDEDFNVEYYYPTDNEVGSNFVLNASKKADALTFSSEGVDYTVYNTPTEVGLKVVAGGKTYDMQGDLSTLEGEKMSTFLDLGISNLTGKN